MLEKREKIKYLCEEFKLKFREKSDCEFYSLAKNELYYYRLFINTQKEEKHLKRFAKEYFKFRNYIIFTRNDLISFKSSEEYRNDRFINRIRFKRELKKYQKLCDKVCEFEQLFYEEMGFSILKVENERFLEEVKQKEQNAVKYLN